MTISMNLNVTSKVNHRLASLLAFALVGSACPAPLPGGTDSDGSTGSTGSTATDGSGSSTSEGSSSGGSGSSGSSSGSSDTSSGSTSASSTTGGGACPANPDFTCAAPYSCAADECGGLEDRFDEDGCLRPSCGDDSECGGGEVCYRPADWGGCAGSVFACSDMDGSCQCYGTDDCGGAYCVPESLAPAKVDGPAGPGRVDNACSPDDGPAVEVTIGLDDQDAACKAVLGASTIRVVIWNMGAPLAPGIYALGPDMGAAWYDKDGDGMWSTSDVGVLTIDGWDANGVSGSYSVIVDGEQVVGSFAALAFCDNPPMCG